MVTVAGSTRLAVASGAFACIAVGGSVPITGMLDDYPIMAGQAMRYALGGVILLLWARGRQLPLPRPAARDVLSLVGLAATGLLGFNACMVVAQRYADPGFVAAMLGGTPLVLALLAPLLAGRRPAVLTALGAGIVVVGIVVLSGGGSWHGPGLLLALLTMLCEAAFTLLAVGVVSRLGGLAVSTYCCFVAAVLGGLLAAGFETGMRLPTGRETVALLTLAVVLTAIGFCCWYRAVSELGADRAGVLVGLMPVSGLAVSVLLGAQSLTLVSCVGVALVTAGCLIGLRHEPSAERREPHPVGQG
jgi:drug/metabolite transporter (DMT)-like permease